MSDYSMEEGDLDFLNCSNPDDFADDPPIEITTQTEDLTEPQPSTSQGELSVSGPKVVPVRFTKFGESWCKSLQRLGDEMELKIPQKAKYRKHYITREQMDQKVKQVKAALEPAFTQLVTSLFIDQGYRVRNAKKRPAKTNDNLVSGVYTKKFIASRNQTVTTPGYNFSQFHPGLVPQYSFPPSPFAWPWMMMPPPPPPVQPVVPSPVATVTSGAKMYDKIHDQIYGEGTGKKDDPKFPRNRTQETSRPDSHSSIPKAGKWPDAYKHWDSGLPMVQEKIDEIVAEYIYENKFTEKDRLKEARDLLECYVVHKKVPFFNLKLSPFINRGFFHQLRERFGLSVDQTNQFYKQYCTHYHNGQEELRKIAEQKQQELTKHLSLFPSSVLAQTKPRPQPPSRAAQAVADRISRNPGPVGDSRLSSRKIESPPRRRARSPSPRSSRRRSRSSSRHRHRSPKDSKRSGKRSNRR